ncbi:unnamed protein product [Rotaria sp. Silwood2]|nr:unnamed protein product [Rotaria sp. Silwood2]CAF2954176.1 unnamed protein product [Rotaria sp. Silwood2]CAF3958305.1 unnamed protein product [Rotaria sp. Silwood2]CAF4292588.1 unnamed protein product [Rotaria sp. Silwood2]
MSILFIFFLINYCYAAESLSSYNVDPSEISVSGLSSGAYFATQVQVAFSASIKGAGIIAGGPYDCGAQMTFTDCMLTNSPSITKSISNTKLWSGNEIDDIKNLSKHKVYLIRGTFDSLVGEPVMTQLYKYYVTDGQFIPSANVVFKNDLNAAHTFPTDFDSIGNNDCGSASSPFISNCDFDGAGAILEHIYGPLKPRNNGALNGKFIEFDQGEFLMNSSAYGISDTAWIYVPKSCSDGAICRLHITFHGCQQSHEIIGAKYIKNTGFNRWADTNNIIILYPQTAATNTIDSPDRVPIPNANGCWDWIGWYGSDFDIKSGKQLSTIKKMMDRITSGFHQINPSTELQILVTTHNSVSLLWKHVSSANGYNIYRNASKTNNEIISGTTFTDTNLDSGTIYTFFVKAVSSIGTESIASNFVTAKIADNLLVVAMPNGLISTYITSNSISLKWNTVLDVATYNIYRDGNKIANVRLASFTDTCLKPATNYHYQVSSVKDLTESEKSMEVNVRTLPLDVCFNDNNYNYIMSGRAYCNMYYSQSPDSNQNRGLDHKCQRKKENDCTIE